jgi:hypothetical protein
MQGANPRGHGSSAHGHQGRCLSGNWQSAEQAAQEPASSRRAPREDKMN